jgi:hypothetical protein
MQPPYYNLEDLIKMIDEPNQSICLKILEENLTLFQTAQGSSHNHQAWQGGYADHIEDVMNISVVIYKQLDVLRPLPFSLSDVLLVLFLHDIEKPWKYEIVDGSLRIKTELIEKEAQKEFRSRKLKEYGISLTTDQENGMKYVEGEYKDYSSHHRAMNPLAALCHLADVTSARIWFDRPSSNDEWKHVS